jgi:hypothetical protein
MIVSLSHRTRALAGSIGAFCISALLFSGVPLSDREHESAALHTATPTQYELKVFVNCNMAAFANSAGRADLMSLCGRKLVQAVLLDVSPCFALLDAIQVIDWRAARWVFHCMRGFQQEESRPDGERL